jgi:sulfur relay (sulfurtransferase) DsrC/TusE family protein
MGVSRIRPCGGATGTRGSQMEVLVVADRSYPIDRRGFLADPGRWDLQFAAAVAGRLGQPGELTLLQLKVVLFVRRHFVRTGEVARVHLTCRACGVSLGRLRRLFPWGYQRGVCRLAGIPYEVIDSSHHALTYETIARRDAGDDDSPPGSLPRANGDSDG